MGVKMNLKNWLINKFSKKFVDIEKLNSWSKKGVKPYF